MRTHGLVRISFLAAVVCAVQQGVVWQRAERQWRGYHQELATYAQREKTNSVVDRLPPRECGTDQQTPILHNGHIYCVIPQPGELVCVEPLTGRRVGRNRPSPGDRRQLEG
jgi:hypothetical protein